MMNSQNDNYLSVTKFRAEIAFGMEEAIQAKKHRSATTAYQDSITR